MSSSPPESSPDFNPRAPLQRAANISIELDGAGRVQARLPDGSYHVVPHGLAILGRFTTPESAADVLHDLPLRGARDWIAALEAIRGLYDAGLLHESGRPRFAPIAHGFEGTPVHTRMLNDRGRTEGFLRAIAETVRPGDVVVDIGTGTGILALAALRAGARRVYAIEASSMADTAAAVFAANGVSDRIAVIRGTSSAVSLGERADVIVAELIGHHAFEEGLLSVLADARIRHGRPGARLIPRRVEVLGLALEIPERDLAGYAANARAVADWKEWYGFDLSPLAQTPAASTFTVRSEIAATWPALTSPATLVDIDLQSGVIPELVRTSTAVRPTRAGRVNALALGMRVTLSDDVILETTPGRSQRDNHWQCPIWLPREPFAVAAAQSIVVRFSHGEAHHARGEYAEVFSEDPGDGDVATASDREATSRTPTLTGSSRVSRASEVVFASFNDEIAVAAPRARTAIVLEGTGASIWKSLESPALISEVCRALAREFDIEPEDCEEDVLAFLQDLRDRGLIRIGE